MQNPHKSRWLPLWISLLLLKQSKAKTSPFFGSFHENVWSKKPPWQISPNPFPSTYADIRHPEPFDHSIQSSNPVFFYWLSSTWSIETRPDPILLCWLTSKPMLENLWRAFRIQANNTAKSLSIPQTSTSYTLNQSRLTPSHRFQLKPHTWLLPTATFLLTLRKR